VLWHLYSIEPLSFRHNKTWRNSTRIRLSQRRHSKALNNWNHIRLELRKQKRQGKGPQGQGLGFSFF
jgi:hypothetical protein